MKPILVNKSLACLAMAVASLFLLGTPAEAAMNVYVQLTANGEAIDGDTTVQSMGGVDVSSDHLEINAFNHEIFMPGSVTGQPSGRTTHVPFKFVKRIDKSSPLLMKALSRNEVVNAVFKFFQRDPDSGEVQHYYTVELHQARISGVRSWSPNNLDPASSNYPFMEEVSIIYGRIVFRHEPSSIEYEINLNTAQ